MTIGLNYNDVIRDLDFFMSPEYSNSIDNFCNLETKKTTENLETKKTKEEFQEEVVKSYEVYQKRKNDNQFLVFNSNVILTRIFSFISGDKLPSVRLCKVAKMRLVCKNWKNKTEQLLQLHWNLLRKVYIKYPCFTDLMDQIDKMPPPSYMSKFKTYSDKMKFPNEVGSATLRNLPINSDSIRILISARDLLKIWNVIIERSFGFPTLVSVLRGRSITMRASEMNASEVREQLKMDKAQNVLNQIEELDLNRLGLNFVSHEIILHLKSLKDLKLYGNSILSFSPAFFQLNSLKKLDLSCNSLKGLPAGIGNLSKLEWLFLDSNNLEYLPPEIGKLTKLTRLILINNPLKVVPKFSHSIDKFAVVRTVSSFPSTSCYVKKQNEELRLKAKSPWALLYQAILSNKDDSFESLAANLITKEEHELLCQMMLECDGINLKKRNRGGDSKDEVKKGGLPKVGLHVFDLAVKRIIIEKYLNLDPVRKEKVENRIYELAETPMPTDPSERSEFALSNLPRLADALAEEAKSNTK